MAFTSYQLASAIEEVSKQFFVSKDEGKITNQVLDRLFKALLEDVRASKPPGTHFCEIAKLVEKIPGAAFESMGHIPERLAKRLSGKRVLTSIDGTPVQFVFFGPRARDRSVSGTSDDDKRLYLEFQHQALAPALALTEADPNTARAERIEAAQASSRLLSQVIELSSRVSEQASQTQPPRSPRELPQLPRDFNGRDDDLRKILGAIRTNGYTILGLQGPSGIGKTALGLALAGHLAPKYNSSLFLDIKGNTKQPLTPSQIMRHVLQAYYPGRTFSDSLEELSGLYHSLLQGKRALLFFDNARDAAQLQPLIPPPTSFLLSTSVPRFTLPGMYQKLLEPLGVEGARAMLVAVASLSDDEAEAVAKLCGRFPLALRAAGHTLAEMPNISPATYIERLRDTRHRLELVDPTTDRSMMAVLDLSYALLPPQLQAQFDSLAVFPATFDSAAAAAIWRNPHQRAQETLATLAKFSFVEYTAADDRYHLHDLLRAFAHSHVTLQARHNIERRFARHFRSVIRAAPWRDENNSSSQSDANRLLLLEWPNILSAHNWAKDHAPSSGLAARLLVTLQWTSAFSAPMSRRDIITWIAAGTGLSSSRHLRIQAALNLTRQAMLHAYSMEYVPALAALGRLPNYVEKLGDLPSTQCILQTLYFLAADVPDLRKEILDFLLPLAASRHESSDQIQLLATTGRLCHTMGRFDEALSHFERAIQLSHTLESPSMMPMSMFLACETALECHNEALATHYGDMLANHPDRDRAHITMLAALAVKYAASGDYDRAEKLYRLYRSRAQEARIISRDPRTITNEGMNWYSFAYLGLYRGKRAANCEDHAIELLSEAQRVSRERNDSDSERNASLALGAIYAIRKDYAKAKKLLPSDMYVLMVRGNRDSAKVVLAQILGQFRR